MQGATGEGGLRAEGATSLRHSLLALFLQGAPASWWNHLHFQHHAKPNCFRKDPDVNMHPLFFALGKTLSVEVRPGGGWEVAALPFKFGKLQRARRLVTSWVGQ